MVADGWRRDRLDVIDALICLVATLLWSPTRGGDVGAATALSSAVVPDVIVLRGAVAVVLALSAATPCRTTP